MRLWSLHPKYLDAKGLVALWREALLAQRVLRGRTRGYRRHPQLERFRSSRDPLASIAVYLRHVHGEAMRRGYRFDARKIGRKRTTSRIRCSEGQVLYEWDHLKEKLRRRDRAKYREVLGVSSPDPHPLFRIVRGDRERWETVRKEIP
jgi:hypothetical protein